MNYIYCYTNKINGHKYVGKTNNLERRKREHKSNANNPLSKEYNYLFHRKLREYGEENFIFSILQKLEDSEDINKAECFWIEQLKTFVGDNQGGYNLTRGGEEISSICLYEENIEENIWESIDKMEDNINLLSSFNPSVRIYERYLF